MLASLECPKCKYNYPVEPEGAICTDCGDSHSWEIGDAAVCAECGAMLLVDEDGKLRLINFEDAPELGIEMMMSLMTHSKAVKARLRMAKIREN